MKKDFYKKIFYTPLVVFFFLAVVSIINQQTVVVGDYFRPAPERLNIIVDEVEQVLYDIAGSEAGDDLFSGVTSLMQQANCQYADSLCREEGWTTVGGLMEIRSCGVIDNDGVVGSLWSSKSQEEDFYAKQEELQEKKEQLQFLQNILKKEMNHGIAKDIEQMRIQGMDDEADMVEEELGLLLFLLDPNDAETREILDDEIIDEGESILSSSGVSWSTESLINILDGVVSISPEGVKASCVHVCDQEYTITFCFNTTKQESVDLVFNIALEISDLVIDPIEIKEIVLALPEEVDIPEIKLQFSIPIPDISTIEGGFSIETEPSPEKGFYSDEIWLSCPEYESHSTGYADIEIDEINPTEMKWFFETYGYLSDGCNKMTSSLYNPIDPLCYDPKAVISRIKSKCSGVWGCHPEALTCSCGAVDCTICEDLYCACPDTECSSCTIKNAQAAACVSLFSKAGSHTPSVCVPSTKRDSEPVWSGNMLPVMKDKCLDILKEQKAEAGTDPVLTEWIDVKEVVEDYLNIIWSDAEYILGSEYEIRDADYYGYSIPFNLGVINGVKAQTDTINWVNLRPTPAKEIFEDHVEVDWDDVKYILGGDRDYDIYEDTEVSTLGQCVIDNAKAELSTINWVNLRPTPASEIFVNHLEVDWCVVAEYLDENYDIQASTLISTLGQEEIDSAKAAMSGLVWDPEEYEECPSADYVPGVSSLLKNFGGTAQWSAGSVDTETLEDFYICGLNSDTDVFCDAVGHEEDYDQDPCFAPGDVTGLLKNFGGTTWDAGSVSRVTLEEFYIGERNSDTRMFNTAFGELLESDAYEDIGDFGDPGGTLTDMPYECALVAAWEGDIDLYSEGYSETIGGGTVNLDEGKIGVLPDSFIGCDPPEIPSFPKIPLSDFNIEIPDIKTPDINFCPIVRVKLPDVIIEDLEFPDIELCNLQECQELLDFFPNFIDDLPTLGRFQIEVPPLDIDPIEIDGIGVDIEIASLENLSLNFHMPQMPNLNSISLSEFIYEIPGIEMPTPELTFSFGGINVDLMSALVGFILNFIMADLPGGCATLGVKIGCLSVVFEDYHLSWGDFPKIPEIPACVTAQEFCRDSKKKLEGLIDTTNEIAEGIQSTVGGVLQIPGDKVDEIEALINEKVQEKEEEINDMVEDYDLVGEVGEELIELTDIGDIEIDISLADIAGIPETVIIPWDALGIEPKITLLDPIEIEMPTIPLSDIGVEKELIIYIPFLQVKEIFSADIGGSSCGGSTPDQSPFQDFFDNDLDVKFDSQIEDIIDIIKD
jgi:hypothetical protein